MQTVLKAGNELKNAFHFMIEYCVSVRYIYIIIGVVCCIVGNGPVHVKLIALCPLLWFTLRSGPHVLLVHK